MPDYRHDDFEVDSEFLGISFDSGDSQSKKFRKRKREDNLEAHLYRSDSMPYISPRLEAQLNQLENKSSRNDSVASRKDSKQNGLSPELQKQLNSFESGKQKSRFDSYSEHWAELGFTSQMDAEIAYYQELDSQQRKDAQDTLMSKRKRRNLDGSLSPAQTRNDASEGHLSPSERISAKRQVRGKQRMNEGLSPSDLFDADGNRL